MLLSIVSVTCIGILIGLRLRVSSVLAASLVLALVSAALLPLLTDWSMLMAVGFLFALLSALQCGYLVGVVIKSPRNVGQRQLGRLGGNGNKLPRMRHDRGARMSHH